MSLAAIERVEDPAVALLFEYSPFPVYIYDRQTLRFLAVNDAAVERYGYSRAEFLTLDLLAIRPPEDAPLLLEYLSAHRESIVPQGTWRHRTKDGALLDVNIISHRVLYKQHDATLVTAQDVSEQVQADRALRASEERYRTLFETMAQGVVYQVAGGEIVSANPAAERILGLSLAQMQGRVSADPRWRAVQEDGTDFAGEAHPAMVALRTGRAVRDVVMGVFNPQDNAYRWLNVNAVPQFRAGETQPYQVYTTFDDITLRREFETTLEQRVQERTAELLHANRVKDEFLANMSHELRTPLQAIQGYTELLADEIYAPITPQQRNALAMITTSSEHLLQLINDVLDLSKIEAEVVELQIETLDVEALGRSCLAFVKEPARRRKIALSLTVDLDLHVRADQRRLKQILVNLLDNAVKFTPPGGKVNLLAAGDEHGGVRFTVEDSGIGIASDHLQRIFEPFVQADSGLARTHEGSGLGLALVKRLVHLHGGAIQVESTPGSGSRFHVTLPQQDAGQTPPPAEDRAAAPPAQDRPPPVGGGLAAPAGGASILLAEDNEATANIMSNYLQAAGYTVTVAHNGVEVLSLVQSHEPDLILMDIQMPVMDGLETTRRLRQDARFVQTPVIALTALAMSGDKERCLAAGASDYISKPVRLRDLNAAIRQQLDREN